MSFRRIMTWVLVLVMLFSVSGAVAEIETIINEDGSRIEIYSEDGVIREKSYIDSEGFYYQSEFYYPDGTIRGSTKSHIDADGKYVQERFDAGGSLTEISKNYTDGEGKNVYEVYDSSSSLNWVNKSYTDSENKDVSEHYNGDSVLESINISYTDADGKRVIERYDSDSVFESMNIWYTNAEGKDVWERYNSDKELEDLTISYEAEGTRVTENYDSNRVMMEYIIRTSEADGSSRSNTYSPEGVLLSYGTYKELDDGTTIDQTFNPADQLIQETVWDKDGGYYSKSYYDDGTLKSQVLDNKDGYIFSEYRENGVIVSEYTYQPDGSYSSKEFDDAGKVISESSGKATVNYVYRDDALYQTVTQITSDSGDTQTTIRKDVAGNVISETQSTYGEGGEQLTMTIKDGSGKIISEDWREPDTGEWAGWALDHNGVKTAYSTEGDIYIEEKTAPDGTVTTIRNKMDMTSSIRPFESYETYVNGKLVSTSQYGERDPETLLPTSMETRDLDGNVIETTQWEEQPDGSTIRTTKNAQGTVIEERRYNEDELYTGGFLMTANGMEKYSYNDYNDKVVEVYDKAGALVEVLVINRDGVVVSKEVKKVAVLPPQPVYTWFPNNTVSTMGLSFREVKPELTKKWYHFTPIDLSRDGEQVIPLVASNAFIVGRVYVNVKGDEVIVTYMARGQGSAGTFRVHSEFLTFFPDLASVTEVEPEKLGEGFKFGEPISIEQDLNGDTNVLLFVRNVATYRDYYTGDMRHGRYWPNLKQHKEYREALQGMMD